MLATFCGIIVQKQQEWGISSPQVKIINHRDDNKIENYRQFSAAIMQSLKIEVGVKSPYIFKVLLS